MIYFEKVSAKQFAEDAEKNGYSLPDIKAVYRNISLPVRATAGSAGYDFYTPFQIHLSPGESICIPTGIRAAMPEGVVLLLMPRSGLGIRYRLQLANTIGVIDSDYYGALNEGHILTTITNDSKKGDVLTLAVGERFMQGIFLPHLVCDDDEALAQRTGGFGSTGEKNLDSRG